ncbi:DUF445 domain-containing protein [Cohnella zeiphila]|uniref:DUF445 domain-containing protein n=1 Tax=Cohnella zeiphila TaxID=2761120 RepID=A0A7X0SKP7_9BACL|nr:DUF445 domain-containing protein [Cohnella zeiphila]MBB6731777.1 DUF445 domain-containing protein [Cohnella zeiphila]
MRKQAKHTAAVSLGAMAAGFALTFPWVQYGAVSLLHGGFEAGLVGGLADWFAVTALFRRPLGLPIPHTALLPRNRDKVVRSLVSVMENEFLTKESIKQKIEPYLAQDRLLNFAEKHLGDAARAIVALGGYALRHAPLERLANLAASELAKRLRELDSAGLLRFVSEEVVSRGYDERALVYLLGKAEELAGRDEVRRQLGAMAANALGNVQAKGFMGFAVNAFAGFMSEDKLGEMLQGAVLSALRDMRLYEDHPLRRSLAGELRKAVAGLPENEAVLRGLDEAKSSLPERVGLEAYLLRWLEDLKSRAESRIREPGFENDVLKPLLEDALRRLRERPETLEPALEWGKERLFRVIDDNHSRIGVLVRENLDKLDNEMLIEMIEQRVGGDLQWIRVNGALCGFLIGLALEGINMAF